MAAVEAFSNQANGLYPRFLMIPVSIKHFFTGALFFALGAGGHQQESRSLQLEPCELGSGEAIHQSRD